MTLLSLLFKEPESIGMRPTRIHVRDSDCYSYLISGQAVVSRGTGIQEQVGRVGVSPLGTRGPRGTHLVPVHVHQAGSGVIAVVAGGTEGAGGGTHVLRGRGR